MGKVGMTFAASILVLAAGCGGGSDNKAGTGGRSAANGGQCPASSGGQTCTGEDAYASCVMAACGAQYKTCFGNNFASGDFTGGLCADFITCEMKCPCDATKATCEGACTTALMTTTAGQTCMTSLLALSTCSTGSGCAQPVCSTTATNTSTATTTTTSTATSTSTAGPSCKGLLACCTTLAAGDPSAAQSCQTAATGSVESTCAAVLAGIQSAGMCK